MRARAQLQATEDYAVSVFAVLRVPPPFTIEMMTFVRRLPFEIESLNSAWAPRVPGCPSTGGQHQRPV